MRSGWVVVTAVRNPEVGELGEEGCADAGRRQPVGEQARGGVGHELLVDQRVRDSGDGPQFDRYHVVGHPAAVREAAGVGRIEVFSRSMSASTGPVKFWNPGMMPAGMPVSRMASRSARGFLEATS